MHLHLSEVIPETFVYTHVVPEIYAQYGPGVALVLGNALLFACFTASLSHLVPLFIKDRVLAAYALAGLEEEPNPVSRRLVVVTGDNEAGWRHGRVIMRSSCCIDGAIATE
jgi:hypothetical protein